MQRWGSEEDPTLPQGHQIVVSTHAALRYAHRVSPQDTESARAELAAALCHAGIRRDKPKWANRSQAGDTEAWAWISYDIIVALRKDRSMWVAVTVLTEQLAEND